ncbi:MAG: type IV toxin-antitoxin system AbiEi family antitoxin [Candidatus Omnitrophica bacterium]|nr:type IV toxin-antitoxin system AbiEi family antitoxin [Candidatus Omnitrophota bacterium]
MDRQNRSILNNLLRSWPRNTVAVSTWLNDHGVYRQLAGTYVKSGWIERIGQGAFKRSGESLDWSGGLYTLQRQLNMSVHPAGKTALELHGGAHYLPANLKQAKIVLFGAKNEKLPRWFKNYKWEAVVRYVMTGLFGENTELGLTTFNFGNYEIKISSAERAVVELCYDVPIRESFDELDQIMSGLTTLRPRMVQELLEKCGSVKAKRLFMYLAEKHNHAWVKKLNPEKVNFGTGKRSLCNDGHYDSKYKIVVSR